MRIIRTIYHIARADFLERIRQYAFLIILGLSMLAAYFFVPPADAAYVTLYLNDYRGIYSSAWIGGSVALSTTIFLSLFGFYLVKNSIQRDIATRFGQIIATTSVRKLHYLLGKAISNFAVLSVIVLVVSIVSLVMQLVRGEVMQIELWPLFSPFLFLTLPIMAVVAALSVLFESITFLQGAPGNVIYFFVYLVFSSASGFGAFGTTIITSDMMNELAAFDPGYSGFYGIGILILEQPLKLFEWQGLEWTWDILSQRLSYFPIAFILIVASAFLFRGFQESAYSSKKEKTASERAGSETAGSKAEIPENDKYAAPALRAADLTPASVRESFPALLLAEWRLMMKGVSLGWYIVACALIVLCLAMPTDIASQWMIGPLVWIWPLMLWSGIGSREARYQTQYLVAASPRFVSRQLSAVWLSGVLLSCFTGSGMLIRTFMEGDFERAAYWAAAVIMIPSLALAIGVLTKSNRAFEVLYMTVWYLGPFNKMPLLDFLGTKRADDSSWVYDIGLNPWIMSSIYLLISAILLILAYSWRRRLSQEF